MRMFFTLANLAPISYIFPPSTSANGSAEPAYACKGACEAISQTAAAAAVQNFCNNIAMMGWRSLEEVFLLLSSSSSSPYIPREPEMMTHLGD